jgi:hypothetical protein
MSDPGDKTRRGERGPLPRTNLPRPEPGRRRVGQDEARHEAATGPTTTRSTDPEWPEHSEPARESAAPPTAPEPDAARPSGVVDRPDHAAGPLAERPTQLAAGEGPPTRPDFPGVLRQVHVVRSDGARPPAEDAGPASTYVGYVIDGRYRVEGILGRGGMGVVYRARHEVMDKLVAIKILLPTQDGDVVERFVNEARAATAIGNAHIVGTVDFGELPDGSTYFVMEYLEGQTLDRRIKTDGFIAVPRALHLARQIAEGMSAAHRAGIVHRDLKPENIFLTRRDDDPEDFVKLLDFGIAKIQSVQNRITRAGAIFGTPHYMSPEQAAGAEVDPRTDVYSLGVMLYEMVSGAVPFDAENPLGLLTQHLYAEPVPLGRLEAPRQPVPSAVDAIVLKCLAKKPEERYGSMDELGEDLARAERGEPPGALAFLLARAERDQDRGLARAARQSLRRKSGSRWVRWTMAGLVFVGAGTAIATRWTSRAPRRPAVHRVAATPSKSAVSSPRRSVALVFSPIDGEVFQKGKSLGGMPVTISLAPGEVADVEVRRDGFFPEKARLDGTRAVVVLRLTPIPGVEPRVPVPTGEPLEALRRGADAGALRADLSRAAATEHRDARAPVHPDAGAVHAAVSPPPPAPSAPSAPTPPEPVAATGGSAPPPLPGPAPSAATGEEHTGPGLPPGENTPPAPPTPAP